MTQGDTHLLIVDDDERIRVLLQKFLIRNGYLVSAARDAARLARGGLVRWWTRRRLRARPGTPDARVRDAVTAAVTRSDRKSVV